MIYRALDSHIHIWDQSRGEEYIASKVFPQLKNKSFLPSDLKKVLIETFASHAVLVHGPSTLEHTEFCLKLCSKYSEFLSVIGWVDLRSGKSLEQLSFFSKDPNFKGIRLTPMLDAEPEGLLRLNDTIELARDLGRRNLVLEVLVSEALLPAVIDIGAEAPDTNIVIAHFGLPDPKSGSFSSWAEAMSLAAKNHRCHVKVSGFPLRGDVGADFDLVRPYLDLLLNSFGPRRLMYASNWPVATALASPTHWRNVFDMLLERMDITEIGKKEICSGTADNLYRP